MEFCDIDFGLKSKKYVIKILVGFRHGRSIDQPADYPLYENQSKTKDCTDGCIILQTEIKMFCQNLLVFLFFFIFYKVRIQISHGENCKHVHG